MSCCGDPFLNCESCFLNAAGLFLRDCLKRWRWIRAPEHSSSPGEFADATAAIVQKVSAFILYCVSRLTYGHRGFLLWPASMKRAWLRSRVRGWLEL